MEVEAGGSEVQSHSWLHSKYYASVDYMILFLKNEKKKSVLTLYVLFLCLVHELVYFNKVFT